MIWRGVAAEQAGVGDVLDLLQRGTERCGVVTGLADGGADRGGADLRPGRVVPVNVPHHAVHVQARVSRQHAAEIIQPVQIRTVTRSATVAVTSPVRSICLVSL